ncbi:hypothetical protein V5O48_016516 [Marasmius crinis-equi]|uniref:Uncharacterized protein n=1 Tax=Marasmius crinis-equi TaxID=585013 RepID=A0ABR3ERJ6_9AGAR
MIAIICWAVLYPMFYVREAAKIVAREQQEEQSDPESQSPVIDFACSSGHPPRPRTWSLSDSLRSDTPPPPPPTPETSTTALVESAAMDPKEHGDSKHRDKVADPEFNLRVEPVLSAGQEQD